eukprot:9600262-Alexandrium_andersonii.AAC.1
MSGGPCLPPHGGVCARCLQFHLDLNGMGAHFSWRAGVSGHVVTAGIAPLSPPAHLRVSHTHWGHKVIGTMAMLHLADVLGLQSP